jgi:glycosyltransferase involved in cell wall biosynthesis
LNQERGITEWDDFICQEFTVDNMKTVALWYQKSNYAHQLADKINSSDCGYEAHVLPDTIPAALNQLSARDFDLIETDELLRYGSLAATNKSLYGTPFVSHVKGWDDYLNSHGQYNLIQRSVIELMTRYCLRMVDGIMFVSRRTKEYFSTQYELPSNYRYGMPVFDVSTYRKSTADRTYDNFCIATVTNFRYEKKLAGIRTILESLATIHSSGIRFVYRIAGGGQYLDELRRAVEAYDYSEQVEVLGYVEDVHEVLASADLFIYISYLDSLATTVLEAQAVGLPVVASDTGGIPEAVGDAGIICPPDADILSRCVRVLYEKPSIRKELSGYSRDRMEDYSRRHTIRHVEFWDSVI